MLLRENEKAKTHDCFSMPTEFCRSWQPSYFIHFTDSA